MKKRILYVEDDRQIGSWVTEHLSGCGYEVDWLTDGSPLTVHLEETLVGEGTDKRGCDLVILDVMLPGLDGFSLGRRVKEAHPDLPVLMLSARTAIEDKLQGLQFADDYLTKPFHPDELAARVEVLMRRFGKLEEEALHLKHLQVYGEAERIVDSRTGEDIRLTGKQHQIFQYFLRHRNRILTKEQLYEGVWQEPFLEGDKTLMVHIRYLREKLEQDPGQPEIIETIRGIGYRVRA
ncbi:response regulator transcription factor [Gorillibacterium timonense]|uniref:response regulator transcription factor n=1 Tax=Gorillibacterium timonense TaxID=1689269 RepID=UPI00071D7C52|nr:response regulator transcription factor [Gorillibacterium timonense]